MFESILGVMVESMQGSQVYLECTGTQGILERLRPPPLEGRQECWDFFPMKQGNGPSPRNEDGIPGLFLNSGGTLAVLLE